MSIAGLWMIFVKAGRQGWESLLPFYNLFVLFQILYGEGTKAFLLLIPFYNIYIAIRLWVDLARYFGKSAGFAVGLLLMSPVFLLILGLDKGTSAPSRPNPAPPTAPSTLYVSIQFGTLAGAAFPITANGATIGRDPSCMICLPANTPGVSRQHCRVTLSGSSPASCMSVSLHASSSTDSSQSSSSRTSLTRPQGSAAMSFFSVA